MDYCNKCGAANEQRIPEGDDKLRAVCAACGTVHYQNPRMIVGCIIEEGGKLLLCKRAIEPRRGRWTIPAGFLEMGESAPAGAIRETVEEAGAQVEVVAPYAHFDVPHIGQAYILYRARMLSPDYGAGPESLEVEWTNIGAIPWGELAFPVVRFALELLLEDLQADAYRTHVGIVRPDGERRYVLDDHLALPVGNALT